MIATQLGIFVTTVLSYLIHIRQTMTQTGLEMLAITVFVIQIPKQLDFDSDTFGDVCDNCPDDTNVDQTDTDNDSVGNACDNCPLNPNSTELGTCVKLTSGVFIGTGVSCEDFSDCGDDEACQQNQQDSNLNGIGDACECYSDCDYDTEVGLFDLIIMKGEYGRSDCAVIPCDADCNDDGGVGLFDLIIMKTEYSKGGVSCSAIRH